MSYTEKEKIFIKKHYGEIAKVSKVNNVDMRVAALMVINNAKFLSAAMKQQGYKPGLSIDAIVKDAIELEAAKK